MKTQKKLFGLMVVVFISCASVANALDKFPTGFYWPLNSFTYSTAGAWLGPDLGHAGPHGHIGVDMLATMTIFVSAKNVGCREMLIVPRPKFGLRLLVTIVKIELL